jgi:VIT1/CCC1 family predicted Fe2+/Mn2+ transporter
MARRYLSFTDRTGEVAFAVFMVIIINGYVALSNLNTGFMYIVAVNIGACAGWGFIDGFLYAITSSIDRNNLRNKIFKMRKLSEEKDELTRKTLLENVEKNLNDTLFSSYNEDGKKAIAKDIVDYSPQATVAKNKLFTKEEMLGWASIVLIYLSVGFLLALPFLVLPDKLLAWFISNIIGIAWLFWYGFQLGKILGKHKIALGFGMAAIGILFLAVSYFVWVG